MGYTRGVAVRPISRVIPAVIAGAVGMVAGLGIGLLAASHGSTATPGGTATTSVASSAQWAAEGAQLERETGRNWAYESIPIDVKGNGTYFFDFGPVPASFDYPSSPSGIAFDWPSMRASALWEPLHRIMWPCGANGTSRWVSPCPTFPALTVVIRPGSTELAP